MAFFNSDIKLQLLNVTSSFIPVKFGLRGFYDVGRVYSANVTSNKWHTGYGGGIFLIPLEKSYSLGLNMAFSEEEKNGLIVFELGIKF